MPANCQSNCVSGGSPPLLTECFDSLSLIFEVRDRNSDRQVKSKEQIVQYLKESFALGHRAIASITPANLVTIIENAPEGLANDFPSSPGPDSDSILAVRIQSKTAGDIFLMSISGRFPPKPLLMTPAWEGGAQLSPDRHWLLYQSNESGQPEIYVRRYPTLDREWQVSEGGGVQARWSSTSREIYYRSGRHMMSVALDTSAAEPKFGKPEALFADEYDFGQNVSIPNYDVTRDGRFIMLRRGTQGGSLRVVTNWTKELKRILAAGGVH